MTVRGGGGAATRCPAALGWLILALGLAASSPGRASEVSLRAIPDSASMAGLRQAVAGAPILIVKGRRGARDLRRALLDSTGVWSASWEDAARARPALITGSDATPPAVKPIPWDEISSLETQRPHKLQGAIAGAVLGLAISMVVFGTSDGGWGFDTGESGGAVLLVGPLTIGALVGTFIGSAVGTKTIYRAQVRETH